MKKFIAGLLIGMLLMAGVSYGNQLVANVVDYKISINGELKQLAEQPVSINDKTYLPVRAVAEMLGYDVGFANNEISLTKPVEQPITTSPIVDTPAPIPTTPTVTKPISIRRMIFKQGEMTYELGFSLKPTVDENGSIYLHQMVLDDILAIFNGCFWVDAQELPGGIDGYIYASEGKYVSYESHYYDMSDINSKSYSVVTFFNLKNGKSWSYQYDNTSDIIITPLKVSLQDIFDAMGINSNITFNDDQTIMTIEFK